jgi:hypothetical protein
MDKLKIANMSQSEWEELNLGEWFLAHYAPYMWPTTNAYMAHGIFYDPAEIRNHLYAVVVPALKTKHRKNLDATGEKRNQVLFGTLNAFATKRAPSDVHKQFPSSYEVAAFDLRSGSNGGMDESVPEWKILEDLHTQYAAAESDQGDPTIDDLQERDDRIEAEEATTSRMIEMIRPLLLPRQYQVYRFLFCDRMSPHEVAHELKVSVEHIYALRSKAKKTLLGILDCRSQSPEPV